jgi:muramidase (phage lysozyme)
MSNRAQQLLDFIGRYEARGDYTMVFGGQRVPNLTSMTLNDVLTLMARMLADQRAKRGKAISTAVGKYQIIRKTLLALIKTLNLDPAKAVFTPALQDQMAMTLLRMRGYDRFVAGMMSDVDFGINVAKEWASMPMPNGKSFYAQDGTNKALVSYEEFIRAIRSSR